MDTLLILVAVVALIFYAISWASIRWGLRAGPTPAVEGAAVPM